MKKMMRILCFALVLVMLGSLCACGGGSSKQEESVEDKVRSAVTSKASLEYFGNKIGGNELKSSSATVTNVKKISEKEYNVSGKIEMTDVYGTKWNNLALQLVAKFS